MDAKICRGCGKEISFEQWKSKFHQKDTLDRNRTGNLETIFRTRLEFCSPKCKNKYKSHTYDKTKRKRCIICNKVMFKPLNMGNPFWKNKRKLCSPKCSRTYVCFKKVGNLINLDFELLLNDLDRLKLDGARL